ncbi:MAG: hypothetical protein ACYDAO_04275 [Thermoplasmataceae archaeon]
MIFETVNNVAMPDKYLDHASVLTVYSGQFAGTYTGQLSSDPFYVGSGYVWATLPNPISKLSFAMKSIEPASSVGL